MQSLAHVGEAQRKVDNLEGLLQRCQRGEVLLGERITLCVIQCWSPRRAV